MARSSLVQKRIWQFGLVVVFVYSIIRFFWRPHLSNSITEVVVSTFRYPHPYLLTYVAEYRFAHQVGEFLVRRDKNQQIVPGLAKSWDIAPDRESIVFTIRSELYSAQEVYESLSRIVSRGQTTHSNFASQVLKMQIIAPDQIKIFTRGDAASILSPLVMADAIIVPDAHWITIAGHDGSQVDWTKTRGPYIWKSGSFPLKEGDEVVFVPNKKHYFYSTEQLNWHIRYENPAKAKTHESLNHILKQYSPSFTTIRNSLFSTIASSPESGIKYYQTRPNGVAFIQLNPRSDMFNSTENRRAFEKTVLNSKMDMIAGLTRAVQIPQPGLVGRMDDIDESKLLDELKKAKSLQPSRDIVMAISDKPDNNSNWQMAYATSLGYPMHFINRYIRPTHVEWLNGKVDAIFLSVGMSDTDPVSGATYIFSTEGANADLLDGSIMNLLNSAKKTKDSAVIANTVRNAFKVALSEGLVIPLFYTANRHYFSQDVILNITDPFAESVQIWNVRAK